MRKRLSRHDLVPFVAKLPIVLIGIEACGGAHDWARRFRAYGHEVKLMAPQFVKPYVKSNKNDSRDAEAIAEAVTRPTMRFVPTKDVAQQDIQALHRVRERLMGERTALVNEVHGLMHEYGIVMPKGAKFRQAVVGKLEAEKDKLTPLSQEMFWKLVEEFAALEEQLAYYQEKQAWPTSRCRLMTIPDWALKCDGPGGRGQRCQRLQERPAICGLAGAGTASTFYWREGALVGISKRGDSYLRKLLIHGARATMRWVGRKTDRRSQWIRQLSERRGKTARQSRSRTRMPVLSGRC